MFPIGDLPDSAAEIAAEQLVAVMSMELLWICNEKVVPTFMISNSLYTFMIANALYICMRANSL